jgi:hypothetical protein
MVEIFGKYYYIDLDRITDKCRTGNKIKDENDEETLEVNIFKYEVIKMCLDTVLDEIQNVDSELGAFGSADTTVAFKIAFNTLIKNEILIEEDEQ